MKHLPLVLAILLIGCVTPETTLTTVSGAFAYPYEPQEVDRVEIDINGRTYKILAHNVPGGVVSDLDYLPSGEVTRATFYLHMDAVYEVKPLGWDEMTVVGLPFTWFSGEVMGVQVYEID